MPLSSSPPLSIRISSPAVHSFSRPLAFARLPSRSPAFPLPTTHSLAKAFQQRNPPLVHSWRSRVEWKRARRGGMIMGRTRRDEEEWREAASLQAPSIARGHRTSQRRRRQVAGGRRYPATETVRHSSLGRETQTYTRRALGLILKHTPRPQRRTLPSLRDCTRTQPHTYTTPTAALYNAQATGKRQHWAHRNTRGPRCAPGPPTDPYVLFSSPTNASPLHRQNDTIRFHDVTPLAAPLHSGGLVHDSQFDALDFFTTPPPRGASTLHNTATPPSRARIAPARPPLLRSSAARIKQGIFLRDSYALHTRVVAPRQSARTRHLHPRHHAACRSAPDPPAPWPHPRSHLSLQLAVEAVAHGGRRVSCEAVSFSALNKDGGKSKGKLVFLSPANDSPDSTNASTWGGEKNSGKGRKHEPSPKKPR
ncbi:hypothetical protein C8R45DRAFT_935049 [Mycena sanguinolenta]|nr:hypothetical protein C8R45DRAFT_935049 [Mycena sanguinolenta]